ncbi:hypothetical protein ES705_16273 [subsurface metagenome]
MRHRLFSIFFVTLFLTACSQSYTDHTETIDLSGTWKFQLDPENVGMKDKWFNDDFNDSVTLPGTTDENKNGIFLDEKAVNRLSRVWYWEGAAWYQKVVDIPEARQLYYSILKYVESGHFSPQFELDRKILNKIFL